MSVMLCALYGVVGFAAAVVLGIGVPELFVTASLWLQGERQDGTR